MGCVAPGDRAGWEGAGRPPTVAFCGAFSSAALNNVDLQKTDATGTKETRRATEGLIQALYGPPKNATQKKQINSKKAETENVFQNLKQVWVATKSLKTQFLKLRHSESENKQFFWEKKTQKKQMVKTSTKEKNIQNAKLAQVNSFPCRI